MGIRVSALTVVVAATAGIGVSVALTKIPLAAAADEPSFKVSRTSWGDPDLQGVWDYRTITPMERRAELGDREYYTEPRAGDSECPTQLQGPASIVGARWPL